ncbi:MAG: enoyl-CoA hydratase/isomerase family protein [Candidatus Lokiarchaeota archaeon]|nr:enoyl-CoA hydratase/isomerase family protein [Candidatus Lokiarchaeota archaeon]
MDYKTIIIRREEYIAFLIINRPNKLNALNKQLKLEISRALDEFERDNKIKVIIISGTGSKAFSVGDDISEFESRTKGDFKLLQDLTNQIANLKKIVIASIDGYALGGGCEIALACDFRIATKNSKFGLPEINLGLIPGAGGSQHLPRLIGKANALELIVTGEHIDANKAKEIGLINYIVEYDELEKKTLDLAKKIGDKDLKSLQAAKELVNYAINQNLVESLKKELDLIWKLKETEESKQKIKLFLKK